MLKNLPVEQREAGLRRIEEVAAGLGVPADRAKRILHWHSHRTGKKLDSMETLEAWLTDLHQLLRNFNQEVSLHQLRRKGPSLQSTAVVSVEE